ncbi:MAG TPA: segregation/condensation protein A [Chitinispirillaceae bacterium]|nr:segregation/condensation protein A [Chitinispirillaceae bacterium]
MPSKQQEYEVRLDLFEGPLDLLLYLVNKSEVSIVDISVSEVALQYIQYLDLMRDLNIDIASEYLHMAATLIRLKARELLPPSDDEQIDQEDGIYNRQQLIEQLLEYKKYKEAAESLKVFEAEQFGAFPRGKAEIIENISDEQGIDLGNISVFDILSAFKKILERAANAPQELNHVVAVESVKLDDRIEYVLVYLSEHEEVPFEDLFLGDCRKIMLVMTFMAILELAKMQELNFRQESNFGPIFVKRRLEKDYSENSNSTDSH